MSQKKSVFLMILATFIWGLSFPITSLAISDGFLPFQLSAFRFLAAAVILSIIFFKRLLKINLKTVCCGSVLGLFLFFAIYLQTAGLKLSGSPSKNAFLTTMYVIIIPVISFAIFRKKINALTICAVFLAILGMGFITLENGFSNINLGDVLTIFCAFIFAFQMLFIDRFSKKHDVIVLNIFQCLTCGILSFAAMFIFETMPTFTTNGIIATVYNTIVSSCIAYTLQIIAQKKLSATKTGILCTLEGVFATVLSVAFFKEKLSAFAVIGFIIVVLAIVLSQIEPKNKNSDFMKIKNDDASGKD